MIVTVTLTHGHENGIGPTHDPKYLTDNLWSIRSRKFPLDGNAARIQCKCLGVNGDDK